MLLACLPVFPGHEKDVVMSQSLRFAEKLASGGAVCGSGAVLHPFWQEKGENSKLPQMISTPGLKLLLGRQLMLQCQNLRGGAGGACWWGTEMAQNGRSLVIPHWLQLSSRFFPQICGQTNDD